MDISEKAKCPHCGSQNSIYDPNHGYYQCPDCGGAWAYSEDDPDYDESDNIDLQDAEANQVMGSSYLTFTDKPIKGNSLRFTLED